VRSLFQIGTDERLNHRFEVAAGVLATDCADALRAFFVGLRAAGEK
jgi:tRNA(adenine34) deaminase